jgi:hypothetical protein
MTEEGENINKKKNIKPSGYSITCLLLTKMAFLLWEAAAEGPATGGLFKESKPQRCEASLRLRESEKRAREMVPRGGGRLWRRRGRGVELRGLEEGEGLGKRRRRRRCRGGGGGEWRIVGGRHRGGGGGGSTEYLLVGRDLY